MSIIAARGGGACVERTVGELETLVDGHESLIGKLQEECARLTQQLEDVATRYKSVPRHSGRANFHCIHDCVLVCVLLH